MMGAGIKKQTILNEKNREFIQDFSIKQTPVIIQDFSIKQTPSITEAAIQNRILNQQTIDFQREPMASIIQARMQNGILNQENAEDFEMQQTQVIMESPIFFQHPKQTKSSKEEVKLLIKPIKKQILIFNGNPFPTEKPPIQESMLKKRRIRNFSNIYWENFGPYKNFSNDEDPNNNN